MWYTDSREKKSMCQDGGTAGAFIEERRLLTVSDLKRDQLAKEYTDVIPPDPEEGEWPDPYEQTYRDGSAKNECGPDGD